MNNRVRVSFSNKPYPLAIEMRPFWRISLVIIIIKVMHEKRKTIDLKKLNILLWMTIKQQDRSIFERFLIEKNAPIPFISSDQASYVAIELAFNKKFITLGYDNEKIYLTEKSGYLFSLINENNFFKDEISFMTNFGYKLTQKNIDQILGKI